MAIDRRNFLKLAGLGAGLGVIGKRSVEGGTANAPQFSTSEDALTAGRWAMVVDLQKCRCDEGCTDCIDACHSTHNVPKLENPKHEVKWIWTEAYEHTFPTQENPYIRENLRGRRIPVFCNHCDNPPCVRVCPTQATWNREDGVVMMDWHRCIGCRYCIAACPYGSRSFNWEEPWPRPFEGGGVPPNPDFPTRTRGVVEKCTFCHERLAKGQYPACVEACTEKALIFGDLEDSDSDIRKSLRNRFSIRRKPGLGTEPQVYYLV